MSVCEPAATRLVAQNTEAAVTCPAWEGHTLLARLTVCGFSVWCKHCKTEHLVAWVELDRLRKLLRFED